MVEASKICGPPSIVEATAAHDRGDSESAIHSNQISTYLRILRGASGSSALVRASTAPFLEEWRRTAVSYKSHLQRWQDWSVSIVRFRSDDVVLVCCSLW
jgi:hypothetical protein